MSPQGRWLVLDRVDSTQRVAASLLQEDQPPAVVFAHDQVAGRGRFDRSWESRRGSSLTFSLLLADAAAHPSPWLVGMACAVAVCEVLGGSLRWPNDVALRNLKVAGILTELFPDRWARRVPVVGIGVNLAEGSFPPELASTATHLRAEGQQWEPLALAQRIVAEVWKHPLPMTWADLETRWGPLDATPGKLYRLPDGQIAMAERVGPDGSLVASVEGRSLTVLAADALFGAGR